MSKERLVVIGNGMAGARVVDDLFARGARAASTPYVLRLAGVIQPHSVSSVLYRIHRPDASFFNPSRGTRPRHTLMPARRSNR